MHPRKGLAVGFHTLVGPEDLRFVNLQKGSVAFLKIVEYGTAQNAL
jgi:hypothetical protein